MSLISTLLRLSTRPTRFLAGTAVCWPVAKCTPGRLWHAKYCHGTLFEGRGMLFQSPAHCFKCVVCRYKSPTGASHVASHQAARPEELSTFYDVQARCRTVARAVFFAQHIVRILLPLGLAC